MASEVTSEQLRELARQLFGSNVDSHADSLQSGDYQSISIDTDGKIGIPVDPEPEPLKPEFPEIRLPKF